MPLLFLMIFVHCFSRFFLFFFVLSLDLNGILCPHPSIVTMYECMRFVHALAHHRHTNKAIRSDDDGNERFLAVAAAAAADGVCILYRKINCWKLQQCEINVILSMQQQQWHWQRHM